ncbi:MAG TPA: Sua5/YciO/YrdC/YwlC family protein, partial [Burkholderiales bacterium]|nr:Sua5/YciO/YrdC/YwlC family protein [Burkholderiales bacterium]
MIPSADIDKAVEVLRAGGLVAFPTETVYGLGADAANPEALKKIYSAKGRPRDHPLIVHVLDLDAVRAWAREVPHAAQRLAA